MTTAAYTELQAMAQQAVAYIARLNGESGIFEIGGGETLIAEIRYEAEIGEDAEEYWMASIWWIGREQIRVEGVCGENGNNDKKDDTQSVCLCFG